MFYASGNGILLDLTFLRSIFVSFIFDPKDGLKPPVLRTVC